MASVKVRRCMVLSPGGFLSRGLLLEGSAGGRRRRHVARHQVFAARDVALAQGRAMLFVLGDGGAHAGVARQVLQPRQVQLLHHPAVGVGQLRGCRRPRRWPSGSAGSRGSSAARRARQRRPSSRRWIRRAGRRARCARRPSGRRAARAGKAVEHAAHLVEVAHFVRVRLAHEHARMLARHHQAGAFQLAQRFAHRHPRNPRRAGHVGLVDALARQQLARRIIPSMSSRTSVARGGAGFPGSAAESSRMSVFGVFEYRIRNG
jgi:hypothetical protein